VALVGGGVKTLALEHVAKVASAVGAHNLNPATVGVRQLSHGSRDGVEKGGPAAAAVELLLGGIQRGVARGAVVGTLVGIVLVVLAGPGPLGTFLAKDAKLFLAQLGAPLRVRDVDLGRERVRHVCESGVE